MREPARAARQCRHRHDSTHTKAPHLQQVHRTVLQPLHPEHVEVERWRADAPEGRQGRSAERDERGTPCAAQPIRAGDGTPWLFPRPRVSLWVCTTAGPGLWGTQSAAGARWQHALFHRRLGRLRATWGGGAPYDNAHARCVRGLGLTMDLHADMQALLFGAGGAVPVYRPSRPMQFHCNYRDW